MVHTTDFGKIFFHDPQTGAIPGKADVSDQWVGCMSMAATPRFWISACRYSPREPGVVTDGDLPVYGTHAWRSNRGELTNDGSRITFYDKLTASVYVMHIDGTGFRKLKTGFWSSTTWRDDEGRDWILCIRKHTDRLQDLYRFNIDNPAEGVLLWDKTPMATTQYLNWCGLSPDGTKLVGTLPWSSEKGVGLDGVTTYRRLIPVDMPAFERCIVKVADYGDPDHHALSGLFSIVAASGEAAWNMPRHRHGTPPRVIAASDGRLTVRGGSSHDHLEVVVTYPNGRRVGTALTCGGVIELSTKSGGTGVLLYHILNHHTGAGYRGRVVKR